MIIANESPNPHWVQTFFSCFGANLEVSNRNRSFSLLESALDKRHIDRIRHGLVSSRAWVKMIAGLKAVSKLERMSRITHRCIEVENSIKSSAGSNPLIHRLPNGLAIGG